jgi:hypothetical protein
VKRAVFLASALAALAGCAQSHPASGPSPLTPGATAILEHRPYQPASCAELIATGTDVINAVATFATPDITPRILLASDFQGWKTHRAKSFLPWTVCEHDPLAATLTLSPVEQQRLIAWDKAMTPPTPAQRAAAARAEQARVAAAIAASNQWKRDHNFTTQTVGVSGYDEFGNWIGGTYQCDEWDAGAFHHRQCHQ